MIDLQDSSFIQKVKQQDYSVYLLIIVNDYCCLSTQCLYCCSSLTTMKQHVISMHSTSDLKNSSLYKHSAAILIIFLFLYMHYFKVNLSAFKPKADSSIKAKFKTAQLKLNDYHYKHHLTLMQTSAIWNQVNLTLWNCCTQWFQHLAELNMRELFNMTTISLSINFSLY